MMLFWVGALSGATTALVVCGAFNRFEVSIVFDNKRQATRWLTFLVVVVLVQVCLLTLLGLLAAAGAP